MKNKLKYKRLVGLLSLSLLFTGSPYMQTIFANDSNQDVEEFTPVNEDSSQTSKQDEEEIANDDILLIDDDQTGETEFEVRSADEFRDAVNQINAAESGEFIIKLAGADEITCDGDESITFTKNTVTLLGEGRKLIVSCGFKLKGTAILNLGSMTYDDTLNLTTNNKGIFSLDGEATLNIYNGVTIGNAFTPGQASAIDTRGSSIINMYGGTIKNCESMSVGAVVLAGAARFNLYDGLIDNCVGMQGGAICISNVPPIAGEGSSLWKPAFYMYGGTISNCKDGWKGGGAVNIYSSVESIFVMEGGVITGCSSLNGDGYGGAIFVFTTDPNSKVELNGGQIYKNQGKNGGAVFNYAGSVVISENVSIYNNSATQAGDDIYNNNGGSLTLGKANTANTLECGHKVDGWYFDESDVRWSYAGCNGATESNFVPFIPTEEPITTPLALKAAHGDPIQTYTVTYNANGGEGDMVDANSPYDAGSVVTVLDNAFTNEGYTFTGWNTAADGTGETYKKGDTFTIAANTILYAQWLKNGGGSEGGGSESGGGDTKPDPIEYGSVQIIKSVIGENAPTDDVDYTFKVWVRNNSGKAVSEKIRYTLEKADGTSEKKTMVLDQDGFTFQLKNGESITFNQITSGRRVEVQEITQGEFTTTISGLKDNQCIVSANRTQVIEFVNDYGESTPTEPEVVPPTPDETPDQEIDETPNTSIHTHTNLWIALACLALVGLLESVYTRMRITKKDR